MRSRRCQHLRRTQQDVLSRVFVHQLLASHLKVVHDLEILRFFDLQILQDLFCVGFVHSAFALSFGLALARPSTSELFRCSASEGAVPDIALDEEGACD